jgi:hypothetical protein
MDEWIDTQLASGRSMSDLVFVHTDSHVEWIQAEGTWAVPSGLDHDDAVWVAVELTILDKVLFAKGYGRGGRSEVGKIVGNIEHDGRHYWLIDFEFEGWEDFDRDGLLTTGGD